MAGRGQDGHSSRNSSSSSYWHRPSTRREPVRHRPVALQESGAEAHSPRVQGEASARGAQDTRAPETESPRHGGQTDSSPFAGSIPAESVDSNFSSSVTNEYSDGEPECHSGEVVQVRPTAVVESLQRARAGVMESGGYISTTRIDRFSGRPGTVSLREFKSCFYSMVDEWEMKLQQHYTPRYSFKMLARYVTDEAHVLYEDHKAVLLRDLTLPNPAYAAAIGAATQVALRDAVAAHAASEHAATTPVPTVVTLTPAQLLAATQGIAPTVTEPAEPDPVGVFFAVLQREYPTKSTQKIQELRNVTRQKGETLKMLYTRIMRLVQDTGSTTPEGAAQKFLRALKADPVLHAKVKDRVFHDMGDTYTCHDVYVAAERYEMANAHYDAHEDEITRTVKKESVTGAAATTARSSGSFAKGQHNHKAAHVAIAAATGTQAFGCNYCASSEHAAPQCACPPTSLHCSFCDRDGHVEAVCFGKHPERRSMKAPKPGGGSDATKGKGAATAATDRVASSQARKQKQRTPQEVNQAEVTKTPDLAAEIESLKAQLKTLTVSMAARAMGGGSSNTDANLQRYGLPYDALMAVDDGNSVDRATRWREYRAQVEMEEAAAPHLNFHERPQTRGVGIPNRAMAEHTLSALLPLPDYEAIRAYEAGAVTRRAAATREVMRNALDGPAANTRGARASIPMSFYPMTAEQELQTSGNVTPPEVRMARNMSLPGTPDTSGSSSGAGVEAIRRVVPAGPNLGERLVDQVFDGDPEEGPPSGSPVVRAKQGRHSTSSVPSVGGAIGSLQLEPAQVLNRIMNAQLFSLREIGMDAYQLVRTIQSALASQVKTPLETSRSLEQGSPPLVAIRRAVRNADVASAGLHPAHGNVMPTSSVTLVDLLSHPKPINSAVLHQVAKGLPAIPSADRMTVNLGAVLVDNRQGVVTFNGLAPKIALLDTGAQPVILGARFALQLGLVGDALQDSAWRIRTAGGQVEKVQGETAQFLSIVFNPNTAQAMELRVRCLVTAATSYDVLLGQEALFPPGVTIDNWTEQAYYRVDWDGLGRQLGFLPLDLHGAQMGSTALAALKEACTAGYQFLPIDMDFGDGSDEEFFDAASVFTVEQPIAYTSATLQLLRSSKVCMQEALSQVETISTIGLPQQQIYPIDSHVIAWTPPVQGITMVELFGGMASGLEAVLKAGMRVSRYVHCDINPLARVVAEGRLHQLSQAYPQQLLPQAWEAAFTTFPSDVTLIQKQHLQLLGDVHLLMAGWECQGFSQAGTGQGLQDARSGLFADLVRIIHWAQIQFPAMGYILENTPAQFDTRDAVQQDFAAVQHLVGPPLLVDAVQCGSLAHRLRNMWTNLAPVHVLQLALRYTIRDPSLTVQQILDEDTVCKPVQRAERPPWFQVNQPGQPRSAWPTLVSYPGSHAFRGEGTGMVMRHDSGKWEPPSSEERERAMGFQSGTTRHRKLNPLQRNSLLGKAMDLNALSWLVSACLLFQMLRGVTFSSKPVYHSVSWHPDFVYLPSNGRFSYMPTAGGGETPGFFVQETSLSPSARHMPNQVEREAYAAQAQRSIQQGSGHPAAQPPDPAAFPWIMGSQLRSEEKAQLKVLLDKHRGCFAFSMKELGRCNVMRFKLNLTDDSPIFKRRHRLSKYEWDLVDTRCKELHEAGLIRPSSSSFAAATVLPAKKDSEGLWTEKRMCGDYRPLNQVTPQDRYPMPTPEEIFDSIGGSKYFSILDLRQGFNQILMAEEDCCKTAFHGSNQLWEWLVMPFGLKNAPVAFQRVMDQILAGADFLKCYVDDVMVHSTTFEEHLQHLEELFHRLSKANMRCHPSKCELAMDTVIYLGHRIVPDGIMPHAAKVDAINKVQVPQDVPKLRAFIGLCNYYRVYVEEFSRVAKPLYNLLKKDVQWLWSEDCQTAFDSLKRSLTEQPLLRRPDFSQPFILHTDWSGLGIGAVLSQQDAGCEEHVVAYASRSNNQAEANYSSYEGECLAVVWAVCHFRPYLYGRKFTLFTDHQPLRWLMTNDKLSGKLARWALILQEYEFEVIHRAGVTHQNADTLSRSPSPSTEDLTSARMDYDSQAKPKGWTAAATYLSLLTNSIPAPAAGRQDIWEDESTMRFLQTGVHSADSTASQRDRVQQRAKRYVWRDSHLVRVLPEGERLVPPIQDRPGLIQQVHSDLGHFGVKRTYSLLAPHYHWAGMYTQVRAAVSRCAQCDRVKSSFNDRSSKLRPLPIQGLFYRWSCDLAGELPRTPRGNVYIMVMIEHFSKWIELVALPDKSSRSTSQAFLQQVLSRFGACAECLTDQGTEFRGEFQDLLDHALIDHRRTSRDHPQADGLAERMVQTVKMGLRKFCLTHNKEDWDLALPYLAMGYRMSRHASLGEFSPYYLLFGRQPLPPSSIARQMESVVDLDSPAVWAQVMSDRAALFKRAMPMAMENLSIAQHRDTLRYAHTRGGSYHPKPRKFEQGDFVYMQKQVQDTLDTSTSRVILRVHSIKPSGILVLQGKDGRLISQHPKHCAPCHLPNLDTTLVTATWIPPADHPCQVCKRIDDPDQMLLCDNCNRGFHLFCLQPELSQVPDSLWFCHICSKRQPSASASTP